MREPRWIAQPVSGFSVQFARPKAMPGPPSRPEPPATQQAATMAPQPGRNPPYEKSELCARENGTFPPRQQSAQGGPGLPAAVRVVPDPRVTATTAEMMPSSNRARRSSWKQQPRMRWPLCASTSRFGISRVGTSRAQRTKGDQREQATGINVPRQPAAQDQPDPSCYGSSVIRSLPLRVDRAYITVASMLLSYALAEPSTRAICTVD